MRVANGPRPADGQAGRAKRGFKSGGWVFAAICGMVALIAAACGSTPTPTGAASGTSAASSGTSATGSSGTTKSGGGGGSASAQTLTISNEAGSLWTCGFNPFNPAVNGTSNGFIYEPLIFVDSLKSGATTPWLATGYKYSDSNKVLTFTIRKGVKWSDGVALTAADVAFTFNLLKKDPGLDLNSLWSVLKSVKQSGDSVVLTFKTPAVPYFYYVADQTFIVPEHIWSKLSNPVTFGDPKPIGSGPLTVSQCTGQNIGYVANAHYWQPGLPKVKKVNYPAFTSNDPANTFLATGEAQWGGQFIPNVQTSYLSKSPDNHYWYPSLTNVSLFINQTVAPLNDVNVRRAMAFAVNRNEVSSIGEYGYEPPANQSGIVTPTFSSWEDKSEVAKYGYTYNPKKAISILEKDGWKMSGGVFAKDGKKLEFSVVNVGGNSDWVASLQVITQEYAKVGIKLTVDELSGTDYDNDLFKGDFQLAYFDETGGPSPYYEMRQWLYGPNSAPIGKLAATNYERYENKATDALFDEYAATTSSAVQHQIIDKLENVMLSDVPLIPMTEAAYWYQYNTSKFTGWETKADPFALPSPYAAPDDEVLFLHLKPT
jgi:peptide/nickel transport system substrate-binding protein